MNFQSVSIFILISANFANVNFLLFLIIRLICSTTACIIVAITIITSFRSRRLFLGIFFPTFVRRWLHFHHFRLQFDFVFFVLIIIVDQHIFLILHQDFVVDFVFILACEVQIVDWQFLFDFFLLFLVFILIFDFLVQFILV